MDRDVPWWKRCAFYHVYPRSFFDSNNDGFGDLPGLCRKLDYLHGLGVEALWLSPIMDSPNVDWGYDVRDFCSVHSDLGTIDDFDQVVEEAHRREMKVVLDLVLNHSSHEHPWFIESSSSRDNPKSDWYLWRDEPNQWHSYFGGPAWTFDPRRGQYYYHYYLPEQPDLNWENPAVVEAMEQVMDFWLQRGVDGFRFDSIGALVKNEGVQGHPCPQGTGGQLALSQPLDGPEVSSLLKRFRTLVDKYPGQRILMGETENLQYLGKGNDQLHLVFNLAFLRERAMTPGGIRERQQRRLENLSQISGDGWICTSLGNHDTTRIIDRLATDMYGGQGRRMELARIAAMLQMTLPGTPVIYYGEELGMETVVFDSLDQLQDQVAIKRYRGLIDQGSAPEEALSAALHMTRDGSRTPLQWGPGPNGDFTGPEQRPWLPVHPNHRGEVSVYDETGDPDSILSLYRALLASRRSDDALWAGHFEIHYLGKELDGKILCFSRVGKSRRVVVLINFSTEDCSVDPLLLWEQPLVEEFTTWNPTRVIPVPFSGHVAAFSGIILSSQNSTGEINRHSCYSLVSLSEKDQSSFGFVPSMSQCHDI